MGAGASSAAKQFPDAILFDIDGVLVDVRRSYLDSIRKTVDEYLKTILLVRPDSKPLLSLDDVNAFKWLGGFNNDWDAVYGLLLYLQSVTERRKKPFEAWGMGDLRRAISFDHLARRVPKPCGVKGILPLVEERNLVSYELAKDMFQEIYLGEVLFKKLYRRDVLFTHARGLIHLEKAFFPRTLLRALGKKGYRLGIVTGRTGFEASFVLKRLGIQKLFSACVTHDDIEKEEKRKGRLLRKPHPFSILLAARKMRSHRFLYIGDLPDDIRAAGRAKRSLGIASCGVLYGQDHPRLAERELKKAGADYLIKNPAALLKILGAPSLRTWHRRTAFPRG